MGTLFDYLNWRGDMSFAESSLNEVDSLIFSLLCYVDFKGIVPEQFGEVGIPIRAAANAFFSRNPDPKKISLGVIVPKDIIKLLQAAKDTPRFRGVELKSQVNIIDVEKQMQFSAPTFLIDPNTAVVAYRGTDDTIIGWKENLNMSFLQVVPAQQAAAEYLNGVALAFDGRIYLTGHSKGGNLSVYAAVHCNNTVKDRLIEVWSNDGPGFGSGMLQNPDYIRLRPIIHSLVPQTSVVGMLLEHDENYTVVKSRQVGLFQHDGLSWNVMGKSFVHLKSVTGGCKHIDRTLNEWVQQMTPAQREQFADALYSVLSTDNAQTLTDLVSLSKAKLLQKNTELDPHVRKTIQMMMSALFEVNKRNLLSDLFPRKKEKE